MAYPGDVPLTALEGKFFSCQTCGNPALLATTYKTTCPVCDSEYVFSAGRMIPVKTGGLPLSPHSTLQKTFSIEEVSESVDLTPPAPGVAPATGMVLSARSPLTGILKQITIHWPRGCFSLVQIRAGTRQRQLAPFSGYHALDNATKDYPMNVNVTLNERLWGELINNDGVFAHTPAIHFLIDGKRKQWYR